MCAFTNPFTYVIVFLKNCRLAERMLRVLNKGSIKGFNILIDSLIIPLVYDILERHVLEHLDVFYLLN